MHRNANQVLQKLDTKLQVDVKSGKIQKRRRIDEIIIILKRLYPSASIALIYKNPWELLVAVILSAQCTDIMVNKVTDRLFRKYHRLEDYINVDPALFEQDIKSTGFFRNKAKNILATANIIKEKYKGAVPQTMDELLSLPGVARKTANIILGNAYNIVEGIAVDTHVHRLTQRLRLVDQGRIGGKKVILFQKRGHSVVDFKKDADPNKIESELMTLIPKREWFSLTYRLIDHGRALCKAQNPHCAVCALKSLCPAARV